MTVTIVAKEKKKSCYYLPLLIKTLEKEKITAFQKSESMLVTGSDLTYLKIDITYICKPDHCGL